METRGKGSACTRVQEWVSLNMRRVASYGTQERRLRWGRHRDDGVTTMTLTVGRASFAVVAGLMLVSSGSVGATAVHASAASLTSTTSVCAKRPAAIASAGTTDAKSAAVIAASATPSPSASASPSATPSATATPTPTATDPSPTATSPSPNASPTPDPSPTPTPSTTPTPTPSPTPTLSPSPSPKTPQLCASVQPFSSSSVKPGGTASYEIFVWSTGAEADGATVSVGTGSATDVEAPYFRVCSEAKDAVCTLGDLPTSQSDELVAAVRVRDAAPNGEKITLTAAAKATKATSFDAKATIDVAASSSSSSSTSTSTSTSGVGDSLPGTYIPNLSDGGLTTINGSDPAGLFPTVTPAASASTPAKGKKDRNVDATTMSSTLPLDSRLIGGQLAGLAVLASAIAIAIARLSLRTQRPNNGGGGQQK
jgi:hypothetical protein